MGFISGTLAQPEAKAIEINKIHRIKQLSLI
jgi:hypothetical protein